MIPLGTRAAAEALGTGLLLSFVGAIIWVFVPPRADSPWRQRQQREQAAKGD